MPIVTKTSVRELFTLAGLLICVWVVASAMTVLPEYQAAHDRFCLITGLLAAVTLTAASVVLGIAQVRDLQGKPRLRRLRRRVVLPSLGALLLAFCVLLPLARHFDHKVKQRSEEILLAEVPVGTTLYNEYASSATICWLATSACGGVLIIGCWIELVSFLARRVFSDHDAMP